MIDLKTKGYTVIPNFLTQEEIDIFLADYNKVRTNSLTNHPQYVSQASLDLPRKIFSKLTQVSKSSGLKIDMLTPGAIYTSTESMDMEWHQDHQSYYFEQQLYHYLNFYIILEKDDPMLSGLSVIPFDTLAELAPDHVDKFINSGAKRLQPEDKTTRIYDDDIGKEWILPINIEDIKESPKLSPGDLLLIRGDTIHKTQDVLTKRVAISIRCSDSSAPISLKKIRQGGQYKKDWLTNFKFELAFENGNIDTMPLQEFYARIMPGKHTSKFYCLMESTD